MGFIRFIKSLLGIGGAKPLSRDLWSLGGNKARVKLSEMPEPIPKGGAVYLQGQGLDKPVLLLRTEDGGYLAFANHCTHGGRKLDPVPGQSVVRCCSEGHSTFDYEGTRLSGPAKEPLMCYPVEQSDGDLVITL